MAQRVFGSNQRAVTRGRIGLVRREDTRARRLDFFDLVCFEALHMGVLVRWYAR